MVGSKLDVKLSIPKGWGILTACLVMLSHFTHNPYVGFFIPVIFGLDILFLVSKPGLPFSVVLSLSPALGLSLLIIGAYVSSHLGMSLSIYYGVYTLIVIVTSLLIRDFHINIDKKETLTIVLAALVVVAVHFFVYTYPTDNVDNYFHATKTMYIIKYDSMFPKTVLTLMMLTYPGGYHSFAGYLVTITKTSIPDVMLVIRTLSWLLFVFGVYLFSRTWFDNKIGLYSTLAIISTNIIYYYLLVYIEPNFMGFYFFSVMLALVIAYINNYPEVARIKLYPLWGILIGTTSLLVHPYSFQNYVLIIAVYTLFKLKISNPKIKLKRLVTAGMIHIIIPLVAYVLLNPYFWFPSLAHQKIELSHPWALSKSITIQNLSVFRGKDLHDIWSFFKFMWNWATIRNSNYAGTFFMIVGPLYYLKKKRAETLSIVTFVLFVLGLNLDRLTVNFPIPFYSTAAMEREFLWLVPIFPAILGMGMRAASDVFHNLNKRWTESSKLLYVLLLVSFFLVPSYGAAKDLISAEANFYVTPDVTEDFKWISTHYSSAFILGSCYSDSSLWLPFFEGTNYTPISEPYFRKCHIGNKTILRFVEEVFSKNETLPNTIAFIDTNAPSLNPLEFVKRYRLLRINGNDWIFDMSSRDTSYNNITLLKELRLCSSILPGDVYEYGKYYVWGFTKKCFDVKYNALNGLPSAWLVENRGIIAFNPCEDYNKITLEVIASTNMNVNISINGKEVAEQRLSRGSHRIQINVPVQRNKLNIIGITKSNGILIIASVRLEGSVLEGSG